MPQPTIRVRPCKRLDSLSLLALEEVLLRGLFLMGKKDQRFDTAIIAAPAHQDVLSYLCARSRARPFKEFEAFLSQNLLESQWQTIVDDLINLMATPVFDSKRIASCSQDEFFLLYSDTELKFKALEVTAKAKEMSEVIYYFLKYLLSDYVTKLDCSWFYSLTRQWVARNRRIFLSWPEIKRGKQDIMFFRHCDFLSARTHFDRMQFDYLNSVSSGILKAVPHFGRLKKINIDHVASGELMWAIGCHCPNLEDISLYVKAHDRTKYSTLFEKKLLCGMTSLYAHKKIVHTSFPGRPVGCPRLLKISLPRVEDETALAKLTGLLLSYLPHLEELTGCNLPEALGAAFMLASPPTLLALRSIEELRYREGLQAICSYMDVKKLLPNVTRVSMMYYKGVSNLSWLSNFPKLEFLGMSSNDSCEIEFGPHLRHLKELRNNFLWDEKKLAGFSRRAPSLEVFHLLEGSLVKRKKSRDPLSFPNMKEVRIIKPSRCDGDLYASLLKSCKNLTCITLEILKCEYLAWFNDELVASVVPSLKKLQVITVRFLASSMYDRHPNSSTTLSKFELTEESFYCFIKGCSDLISIGNIFDWTIPHKKILDIKREAKEKNWALNILPLDDL
ncbi:uncharacterized protein [Palaemon carinicauda]|uniref:uncharacterized protein n=1 Tax=Palaemon carinicauda TaxID=392227 RepID=UPI0035B68EC3